MSVNKRLVSTGSVDIGYTTWTFSAEYPGAQPNGTLTHFGGGSVYYWVTGGTSGVGYSIQYGPYFNNRGISSGVHPHTVVGSARNVNNSDLITKGYVGGTYSWSRKIWYGGSVSSNSAWSGPTPLSNTDINFASPDGVNYYCYEIRSNNVVRRYEATNFNNYLDITLPISVNRHFTTQGSLIFDGVGFWYCFNSSSTQWSAVKFSADLSTVTVPQINLINISGANVGTTLVSATYDAVNNRMFLKGKEFDKAQLFNLS